MTKKMVTLVSIDYQLKSAKQFCCRVIIVMKTIVCTLRSSDSCNTQPHSIT
jgi:hypothetical protein